MQFDPQVKRARYPGDPRPPRSSDRDAVETNENASIHIYDTHVEAEAAIRSLAKSGFNVKKLSLVGKGYHSEEHPIGFYTVGDRIRAWGGIGAFWGGVWGLLLGPAIFFLPGLGLIAMAGPVVSMLVGTLEGVVVVGGVSALGAALCTAGIPKDQVIKYETAVKADKYVLMLHGSANEVAQARYALSGSDAVATT
jgi:hypothetical protein